jgi:hypothetical protein
MKHWNVAASSKTDEGPALKGLCLRESHRKQTNKKMRYYCGETEQVL